MKKFLPTILLFLLSCSLVFAAPLPTFIASYDDESLTADYSKGSPTATFTASRDATHPATYIDSSGVIQKTTTSNVGRFNYGYYDTGGYTAFSQAGLMIEGASTNYLKTTIFDADGNSDGVADNWTAQINAGAFDTKELVDVSSQFNVGTTVNAQHIAYANSADGDNNSGQLFSASTTDGTFADGDKVTLSCWLKGSYTGEGLWIGIHEKNSGGGTLATHNSASITSNLSSTEFRRFTLSVTFTEATTARLNTRIYFIDIDEGESLDIQVACIQVEKSPFATSFIPTTADALTRNKETLKYVISGNRTAAVESCVVKLAPEFASTIISSNASITDTDTKRRYVNFGSGSNDVVVRSNLDDSTNSRVSDLINDTWIANTEMTLGYNVQSGTSPFVAGFFDGVADGTNQTTEDFTVNAWGTNFYVGNDKDDGTQLYGTIFSIGFWDIVLSDTWHSEVHTGGYGLTTFGGVTLGGMTIK